MTGVTASCPSNSSDAYRRQARRLRCRYAGQPHRLHQSLKQLANTADTHPPTAPVAPAREASPTRAGRARSYADHIADGFPASSSVLRYSQRLELLRAAPRFGLNRFEANLAIAAVMARRRTGGTTDLDDDAEADPATERSTVSTVATFVLIQGALVLSVWWTMFR